MEPKCAEAGASRESARDAILRRAADCQAMSNQYSLDVARLRALARMLSDIERSARESAEDGAEIGPHIGVGSDAEQALWMLANGFRISREV